MPDPLPSWLRFLPLMAVLTVASTASANDTAFGGSAAALIPLEQSDVQMRTEKIVLTAHPTEVRWEVSARYEFVHHGSQAVKLQVGFPELRCPEGDSYCSTVTFQRLTTRVDGRSVQHRKGKMAKGQEWNHHLGTVWLFDVTFPPGKTVVIEHEYAVPGSLDSMGNRYLTYVTRTGRTWAKTIEKAQFFLRLPPFTHTVLAVRGKGVEGRPPRVAADGTVEFVAEATHWVPEEDVAFGFNASSVGTDAAQCRDTTKPEDAQSCINALYAAKGYPFRSAKLTKIYYSGNPNFVFEPSWSRWRRQTPPQSGFTTEWFEPWESERLRVLEKQAKQYREAQGEAAAEEVLPAAPAASATSRATAPPRPRGTTAPAPRVPSKQKPPAPSASAATVPPPPPAPEKRTALCQATPGERGGSWTPSVLLVLLLGVAARRVRQRVHVGVVRAERGPEPRWPSADGVGCSQTSRVSKSTVHSALSADSHW